MKKNNKTTQELLEELHVEWENLKKAIKEGFLLVANKIKKFFKIKTK